MYNPIRGITGLANPIYLGICFGLICLWSSNALGQIYAQQQTTTTQTQAPDLQVKQMTYHSAGCTMWFLVYNNGSTWSKTTNIWSGYQSNMGQKSKAVSVPVMAAKTYSWVSQPMWEPSKFGPQTCGMNGVTSVRGFANARYAYKYSNGAYSVGTLVAYGSYAPAGWSIAEPGTAESNKTNNELTLQITAIPVYTMAAPPPKP